AISTWVWLAARQPYSSGAIIASSRRRPSSSMLARGYSPVRSASIASGRMTRSHASMISSSSARSSSVRKKVGSKSYPSPKYSSDPQRLVGVAAIRPFWTRPARRRCHARAAPGTWVLEAHAAAVLGGGEAGRVAEDPPEVALRPETTQLCDLGDAAWGACQQRPRAHDAPLAQVAV